MQNFGNFSIGPEIGNADSSSNSLLEGAIKKDMIKEIGTLLDQYPIGSRKSAPAYAEKLFENGFTPTQIKAACKKIGDIYGGERPPSAQDLSRFARSLFPLLKSSIYPAQLEAEQVRFRELKESFLERFTQTDLTNWTRYYCVGVFDWVGNPPIEISVFEPIALIDLNKSGFDKKKAIWIGKNAKR